MAIAALGALAGSLATNLTNAQLNEEQRKWSEYMWEKQQAYNTPANQMKRLRDAGINPHFAISGGQLGTGNASSQPDMTSPAPYDFSPIDEGIARAVELFQEKRVQDSDISLKNEQANNQRLRNVTQLYRDVSEIRKILKDGNLSDQQRKNLVAEENRLWIQIQSEAERNEVEIDKARSDKALADAQAGLVQAQAVQQKIINSFAENHQRILLSNLKKEGSRIDSEVKRNDRVSALKAAEEALTNAQKRGVKIDNDTKEQMAKSIVDEKFYQSEYEKYKAGNEYKMYRYGRLKELPSGGNDYPRGSSPVNK